MDIRNIKIMSLMLVCLLSMNFIFALGISSPYWNNHPLEMYPGETKDVAFTLVNRVDAETANAFVTLDEGGEIAKITSGKDYIVNPGTVDTKIVLQVSIPEEAEIGDSYNVKFSVKSAPEGAGTVQLSIKYNVDFPVTVIEKPSEIVSEGLTIWGIVGIIVAIVVVLLVILLILKKKK